MNKYGNINDFTKRLSFSKSRTNNNAMSKEFPGPY